MAGTQKVVGVSLLGPVEARSDAEWSPVAGVKLQALLAALALAAPRPVSDGRLIEDVWGDSQPTNPANALQAQISQLRRVLGPDVVVRDGSGYALLIEPDDVDAVRLERLVREGRAAAGDGEHRRAAEQFRTAVSLSRGPPLGDLLDREFARTAASRLEQLIISAHEGLIDAELASGRHADVVVELTDLVKQHPLWERFHAQLILALFRCGRQTDALRAYQNVRELLATEMGLEPGPELRSLERAVLSHDPALAAPVPLVSIRQAAAPPQPLTSFVGRASELRDLADAIASSRLVTLIGPAGAGKTRLVLEMAGELPETQEWSFVELAPVTDEQALPNAVASAVGAQDHAPSRGGGAPRPPETRVIERLGDRPVIIVLDNCEHVLDAAGAFAHRLLTALPGVTIVATSRESLGVEGERQIAVGSLTDQDATMLFSDRADAVQPHFQTDEETATEVADLCRHLDGLPLAIELAAARTKTMPVPEIAARLQDRFQLLVGTKRSDTGRQRGLRTAIDWSYDLLFEEEQRAFRWLAAFTGGATTDAAGAVLGAEALDLVARLVDKSLLVADTSARAARFRMLESLRAYGIDRLADTEELADAFAAHLRWCIDLAEHAELGIRGHDQIAWLDRLDAEHDNLQSALANAATADPDGGLRLIGALILPWWFRGRGREAREWVETFLTNATDPPAAALTKALTWSGIVADFGGGADRPGGFERELELADQRQRHAVTLGLSDHDSIAVAYARTMHSLTLTRRGLAGIPIDPAEVAEVIEAAAAAFDDHGDEFGASMVRTVEAVGLLGSDDVHRTAVVAETARIHADGCGNRFVQGRVEWIRGLLDRSSGDTDSAYRHAERGLRLLDELGMGQEVTAQAGVLIELAEERGESELAAQWRTFVAGRSGGLARHDALLVASSLNREGLHARAAGDLDRAHIAHLDARDRYADAGVRTAIAFSESCLGFLTSEMGDHVRAGGHHAAALDAAMTAHEPTCLALALEGTAAGFGEGQAEWAVVLLGAASRLWVESSMDGTASHRPDIAATTARAQRELGSPAFERAYERGTTVGSSDAVAMARSGSVAHA